MPHRQHRILHLDNVSLVRDQVKHYLARAGHQNYHGVGTSTEAFMAIGGNPLTTHGHVNPNSLLIADVQLGMGDSFSGLDVVRFVKDREKDAKRIGMPYIPMPVIIVSTEDPKDKSNPHYLALTSALEDEHTCFLDKTDRNLVRHLPEIAAELIRAREMIEYSDYPISHPYKH
jgi:CheY-like chemotaxis protein